MPRNDGGDPTLVQTRGADPNARKDKPDASPPALRRKLKRLEDEARSYYEEKTRDDRQLAEDEFTRLENWSHEQVALQRQIEVAERWHVVDSDGRDVDPRDRDRRGLMPFNDPRNVGTRHQYSLRRALLHVGWPRDYPLEGLELETHQEMARRRAVDGRGVSGVLIPHDLGINLDASLAYARRSGLNYNRTVEMVNLRQQLAREAQQRALDTAAGAGSIPTIVDTTLIELLRPRMVTAAMGARVMTDMQGLFAIPRQATASTFYMVAQGGSVTASNQTIDQVPFSPHTGGCYTTWTRQFLEQTNQDAEMFVREDHSAQVARGVETAALNGQAALGWPMGILQNPQIGVYALGTNGAAPTWTQLVSMEAYVAYYNADVGNLSFVCDALTRGTLKLTLKVSGSTFPIYLWNTEAPDFPLAGYPCPVTNLLPQNISKGSGTNLHAMTFGNWNDLIYAFWSGLDVIIDPYTSAPQGAVNMIALQDFDVNIRHYQSFANCVDIISSITAPTT